MKIFYRSALTFLLLLGFSLPVPGQTAPTLTQITRTTANQGASFNVILIGTGFTAPLTIDSAPGVSFSNIVITSSVRIDAKLTVSTSAATGDGDITVTTPDGTSNAQILTVFPPPFISSITPSVATPGEAVTMTISGGNFLAFPTVTFLPFAPTGPISVQSWNSNSIVVKFTVSSSVIINNTIIFRTWSLGVSAGGAATNLVSFDVVMPGAPTLTGLSVSTSTQASSFVVTLTGTNFQNSSLTLDSGISYFGLSVNSSTSITATFVISATASLGDHNVSVTNAIGGTSNALIFTVTPHPAPTLTSISSADAVQGFLGTLTLTGTNFAGPATINAGTGISVANIQVKSPTSITASFSISINAPVGPRDITITSPGGTTSAVTFTVIALPTLTSISPIMVGRGKSTQVNLIGTNFLPNLTVTVSSGVTVTNLVVNSPTSATATFESSPSATIGWYSITIGEYGVTQPTYSFVFAVTGPPPVLSLLSPNVVTPGMSGLIQLTGTDFYPLNPVSAVSAGCPYFNFNSVSNSSTTLTGSYSIPSNATLGTCSLTLNALQGPSNSLDFTIAAAAPPPTLTSINPPGSFANGKAFPGSTYTASLGGTGFSSPLTIDAGNGISVSGVEVLSSTGARATFTVDVHATPGRHNVSVTTLGGKSNTLGFAIYSPIRPNFNGGSGLYDSTSDLLWYNTSTGQTAEWLISGVSVTKSAGLQAGGTGWTPKQIGDFDGDSSSDILWQHTDGSVAVWLMDGLSVKGGTGVLGGGTGWSTKQNGDFDGDGKSDILWEHTDGRIAIWLMNGLSVKSGAGVLGGGTGWNVKQIGDFDGDGKSDILWEHTNGSTAIWLMNGLSVKDGAGISPSATGWSVKRIGDFDGDNKSDILWEHTDGRIAIWLMNGLSVKNGADLLPGGTSWSVKQIGDFDGDGRSDILWQHTDGSTAIWLVNDLSVNAGAGVLPGGTGWSVKQLGDYNSDGKSDILWRHTDGSTAIWLMNGLNSNFGAVVMGAGTNWEVVSGGP